MGTGDSNEENGPYQDSAGLLYGIACTVKMSNKGAHQIDGYFDFVALPLEGSAAERCGWVRMHHEIYLSDARKVEPGKWKTVIRHPVKKLNHTI